MIYLVIFILNTWFMFLIPRFVSYVLQPGAGYVLSICMACFSINIFCIGNYIYERYNKDKKNKG